MSNIQNYANHISREIKQVKPKKNGKHNEPVRQDNYKKGTSRMGGKSGKKATDPSEYIPHQTKANIPNYSNQREGIKLQKYFTELGIMSRRSAEQVISNGEVTVNGEPATLGQRIVPERDRVVYNAQVLGEDSIGQKYYIMFNKPRAVITSLSDEHGRRCISDFISDIPVRVYPVGRLDYNSDGLLILTNDGELTNMLTHPKHMVPKIYLVKVSGKVSAARLEKLRSPLVIDGYEIMPVEVMIVDESDTSTIMQMMLFEGRNRQIRKMCDIVGLNILRLKRVAIGSVELSDLPAGKWRYLTQKEIDHLVKENK